MDVVARSNFSRNVTEYKWFLLLQQDGGRGRGRQSSLLLSSLFAKCCCLCCSDDDDDDEDEEEEEEQEEGREGERERSKGRRRRGRERERERERESQIPRVARSAIKSVTKDEAKGASRLHVQLGMIFISTTLPFSAWKNQSELFTSAKTSGIPVTPV